MSNVGAILRGIEHLLEDLMLEINATPTGPEREALTETQIVLMDQQDKLRKAALKS